MCKKNKIKLLISSVALMLGTSAYGATNQSTPNVKTSVASSCSVDTGAELHFGAYEQLNDSTASMTVDVTCNGQIAWTIHSPQTLVTRRMTTDGLQAPAASAGLGYSLTVAGVSFPITAAEGSANGSGSGQSAAIDGTILAGQNVDPGDYWQSIPLTITF
ncbi:MAG: spore coat protein U-like protein [Paraglaciecola sp.]|jgi:spore coat protein U-like protein